MITERVTGLVLLERSRGQLAGVNLILRTFHTDRAIATVCKLDIQVLLVLGDIAACSEVSATCGLSVAVPILCASKFPSTICTVDTVYISCNLVDGKSTGRVLAILEVAIRVVGKSKNPPVWGMM